MKCKNPICIQNKKGWLCEEERDNEDGMVTVILKCDECGWSCKVWYDLDDCEPTNIDWLDENEEPIPKN